VTRPLLTAVAPDSLRSWYHVFADQREPVVFLGERADGTPPVVEDLLALANGAEIRLLSSHDSLRRDLLLAESLRAAGAVVWSQSALAVRAATDKVFTKRLLEEHGLPVPRWGVAPPAAEDVSRVLSKRRDSTQSQGLAWAAEVGGWAADVYWEEYLDGIEYSVVLYREAGHITVLPPIWKGATRCDLLPPWQRLRVCPVPRDSVHVVRTLIELGCRVAHALDVWGFTEVEFIVTEGDAHILEVNPRVCGTMRLAAMAAGIAIFDSERLRGTGVQHPAIASAGELPYGGAPFVEPQVIATSRVTCAAPTAKEVRQLLEAHAAGDAIRSAQWPVGW